MKNKLNILITGAAGLIGQSLAYKLVSDKHCVILSDINHNKLKDFKKKNKSKNIEIFHKNLNSKKNIDQLIKFAEKKFKKIDVAVHCAYPKSKQWGRKFEKIQKKFLDVDLQNQLGGTIMFSQRILENFKKKGGGNLILISSILGTQPPKFWHYKNTKINSPLEYTAIKAGIIAITKYLAKYYKKKNIRINCVSPGGIEDQQPEIFRKRYQKSCNSKGLLNERDVVNLLLYLISDKSKYITGQNLVIDDGWSL